MQKIRGPSSFSSFKFWTSFALRTSHFALLILLPFLAAAAPASFRFAWLSDTHVGSASGEDDLRATVKDLNSSTGLSFVVISGDVTEYGSREQLRLAHDILGELKLPCHVIPGNHDTKWSESGATDFPRLWGDDRFVFEHGGFCFIGMHEGPLMKMGDGHWSPQDVRWLKSTLEHLADPHQPIVFMTHYPLDDGIANWFVVVDLLKRYNIQVALCGHVHRNSTADFEGIPGVTGRSNLRGTAAAGGYTLVDVEEGARMVFSERIPGIQTKAPWHRVTLQTHDFAAVTNRFPRPDFSVNARYPAVKEVWTRDTGHTIASAPAVSKGLAILGDASGTVRALELKNGQPRWEFSTRGPVYSTPDTSGDLLVVPSTDGSIYALGIESGKPAWSVATQRPIVASPRIADGVVYLGSSEGKFRALALSSGKILWEFDGLGGFVETRPLVYEGKVIFGAWDQHLYALDTKTGRLAWKWKGDRAGTLLSPAACWPVGAAGRVFIVAPDRKMTALNARTGERVWRTGNYIVRETIGPSADGSQFYVRAMQDFIYAFSTAGSQPKELWKVNAGFGYDINSAMPAEKDGVVFYGSKNGLLIALDAKTGAIRWQHRLGPGIINTVVPLSSTQVLATDFDGKVVLVDAKGSP